MKYRRREVIDATQWHSSEDHPLVERVGRDRGAIDTVDGILSIINDGDYICIDDCDNIFVEDGETFDIMWEKTDAPTNNNYQVHNICNR